MAKTIPARVISKIQSYENILISRYPPTVTFYKLSIGYNDPRDATRDSVPAGSVFTSDENPPDIDSTIYTNQGLTLTLTGDNKWFNVFGSNDSELGFAVQISTKGIVINKT